MPNSNYQDKVSCPKSWTTVSRISFPHLRVNGQNGNSGQEVFTKPGKPNYSTGGTRALLSAVLLRAMSDAKAEDNNVRNEAREFLQDGATWVTRHLYGLELDGKALITLIDEGHLDGHLRMKVQRYRRIVHRIDRPDLEEIRLKPLPPELNANLLFGGEKS